MEDQYYPIPDQPQYTENIRRLQNSDPASAEETLNPLIATLIENTAAVKKIADGAGKTRRPHTKGERQWTHFIFGRMQPASRRTVTKKAETAATPMTTLLRGRRMGCGCLRNWNPVSSLRLTQTGRDKTMHIDADIIIKAASLLEA